MHYWAQSSSLSIDLLVHLQQRLELVASCLDPIHGLTEILVPLVSSTWAVTLRPLVQVCYKQTDFLGDQVLLAAAAQGGLSEVPRASFRSCSNALKLVSEIGQFGHPPEVIFLLSAPRCRRSRDFPSCFWVAGEEKETSTRLILSENKLKFRKVL